jgi:putative tryptophan/tyrosine transport system substrate-binding protein
MASHLLAAAIRIHHLNPVTAPPLRFVESPCLMEYAIDFSALFREAAGLIHRVLRGESPATIPFRQPTRFVLRMNTNTAKKINIAIPPSLLLRADEVIE